MDRLARAGRVLAEATARRTPPTHAEAVERVNARAAALAAKLDAWTWKPTDAATILATLVDRELGPAKVTTRKALRDEVVPALRVDLMKAQRAWDEAGPLRVVFGRSVRRDLEAVQGRLLSAETALLDLDRQARRIERRLADTANGTAARNEAANVRGEPRRAALEERLERLRAIDRGLEAVEGAPDRALVRAAYYGDDDRALARVAEIAPEALERRVLGGGRDLSEALSGPPPLIRVERPPEIRESGPSVEGAADRLLARVGKPKSKGGGGGGGGHHHGKSTVSAGPVAFTGNESAEEALRKWAQGMEAASSGPRM